MKKIWIFMAFVAPVGFFQGPLQREMGGPIFLVVAAVFLLIGRAVAERYGK
jgi:hypothetical protein